MTLTLKVSSARPLQSFETRMSLQTADGAALMRRLRGSNQRASIAYQMAATSPRVDGAAFAPGLAPILRPTGGSQALSCAKPYAVCAFLELWLPSTRQD